LDGKLRQAVAQWYGTGHRLGGNDRDGIDCSAFVRQLFADQMDLILPRTTEEQMRCGRPVRLEEVKTGDLVFFHPEGKYGHVGVYLSRDEFAHASTSQGVMVSSLQTPYWRQSLSCLRRVLPP
jgi:cell wall-associated NlpC family hydrolase